MTETIEYPFDGYWKTSLNVSNDISLKGYSKCALNTGFYIKELDIALDAGIQMHEKPGYILITHLHTDHVCALHTMLISNNKKPKIFVLDNDKLVSLLESMIKNIYLSTNFIDPLSVEGLDKNTTYSYELIRIKIGEVIKLDTVRNIYIEGLPAYHGVGCISYGIYEERYRCKQEYKNLSKEQYKKLKTNNVNYRESYKIPILCYMGDTNISPLIGTFAENIFAYPYIIVECSFLEKTDLDSAIKKNHIHWNQLYPIIQDNPKNKFILIHFSRKYQFADVKKFFDNFYADQTKNKLDNVILWLNENLTTY